MENLNKLVFKNYKINEDKIMIPIDEIKQEYDMPEFIKPYLFKVAYVHKYHSPTNTFICYLAPLKSKNLPIIKAQIPLDLIYTHKIIGNYDYKRKLEDNEIYIIKEKIYSLVDKINRGYINYFVMCYGYMINKYKDDDANTQIKKGIQLFNFTESYKIMYHDGQFSTYYIFNRSIDRLLRISLLNKNPALKYDKEKLKAKIHILHNQVEFEKLPEGFLSEK